MKGHAAIRPADEPGIAFFARISFFVEGLTPSYCVLYFQFQPAKLKQDWKHTVHTEVYASFCMCSLNISIPNVCGYSQHVQ
jgi:hypothetical protein